MTKGNYHANAPKSMEMHKLKIVKTLHAAVKKEPSLCKKKTIDHKGPQMYKISWVVRYDPGSYNGHHMHPLT